MAFLTIDCGTSSCRAVTISDAGKILSGSREPLGVNCSRPLFAEVDTDRVWEMVCRVVRSEMGKHPSSAIDGVGVSAMLGYVLLGGDFEPLAPAIVWMDNRAGKETDDILRLFSGAGLHAKTGRRPSPELLAPKLLWLRKHQPQLAEKVTRIIGLKDEIVRRLTGIVQTDVAHLNYTLLYNVSEGSLDDDILAALDVGASLFPRPRLAWELVGCVTSNNSATTGLPAGAPVISGSSDGTTAMYGGGVLQKDRAILVSGTTDVLMMRSDKLVTDPSLSLTVNTAMVEGKYLVGGAMGLSGGTISWLQSVMSTSLMDAEREMEDLQPGSEGLLFIPGLTGERAPFWKEELNGAAIGLRPSHRPAHLYRAVLEGATYRLARLIRRLKDAGLHGRILNVVGGWANLDLWNRIRADVTGLDVARLEESEATSMGTALFCKAALEPGKTLEECSTEWLREAQRFSPDPVKHKRYRQFEQLFYRYMEQMEDVHRELRLASGENHGG